LYKYIKKIINNLNVQEKNKNTVNMKKIVWHKGVFSAFHNDFFYYYKVNLGVILTK